MNKLLTISVILAASLFSVKTIIDIVYSAEKAYNQYQEGKIIEELNRQLNGRGGGDWKLVLPKGGTV